MSVAFPTVRPSRYFELVARAPLPVLEFVAYWYSLVRSLTVFDHT